MKKLLPALLVLCSLCAAAQSTPEKLYSAYAEKGFIENKGQIRDFQGNPASQVKYLYNKGLANLQLRSSGFSYEIFSTAQDNHAVYESGNTTSDDMSDDFNTRIAGSSRIDVVLENANPSPKIYASDATGSYFNFYHSPVVKNHFEKVNSYNTITYQDIYPGIDLVFHAPDADTEEPLQYDFIVHPGADYRKIKLKYHGAAALQLAADGTVRAESGNGYVIEGKPVSFEGTAKKEILTAYNLAKNTISFQVGQYNTGETLVIDPTLVLGTYYGGEDQEEVSKIELDSKSKFLVCGSTLSLTNIATAGAYQSTYGGGQADFFVAKFKTAGNLDWATYIGGTKKDQAYGVIADNNDNVVVVGKSESDGLATVGQVDQSGYGDAYVAKFSPAGLFLWGTYRGYKQDDHFRNVVGDKQGNLYCAGYTLSSSNMTTPGAWQTVYGGEGDCLLAKFKPDGNIAWCTYFGKEGADRLHAIHLDLANHLLVQGTTGSLTGMATPGVHQTTYGGGEEDMLLAQFDTSGVRIWSTYYGGEFSDRGRGVETDSAGNLYVAGLTTSATGISSPGAYKVNWTEGYYSGGSRAEDGYVAKFTSTGQRIWGTYYGSTGYDRIWGITLDRKTKSLYTVGGTSSEAGISTPGGWQQNFSNFGVGEGFFSKWDYNGNLVWGSYVGSNGEEHVEDVALDKNGFIYVLSETDASLMPVTLGTEQSSSNGQDEAVIYKFYTGLNCYDAYEPNDIFNAAKQVTQWLPADSLIYGFNGAISSPSDEDWFKVKIKAANPNIMLILTDLVKDYNLKLYNAQKVLMASSNNNGTTNDTIVYNNLVNGSYFIKISHTNAQWDSLNCYRLLTFKSPTIFPGRLDVNEFSAAPDQPLNLKVFPNPADQLLTFNITADRNSLSEVWVYDMVGRLLLKKQISLVEGFQTLELPIGNLPMGSYKLLVKSESQHWIAGFVKQ